MFVKDRVNGDRQTLPIRANPQINDIMLLIDDSSTARICNLPTIVIIF